MTKSKKVLHVIDSLNVGGAEMLVVNLLRNIEGYELHLIVLMESDALLKHIPDHCKVTILNFRSYWNIPGCTRFIRRYIKRERIDIVHSHLYWSNTIVRFATPKQVPVFNCIQNIPSLSHYLVNKRTLYLEKLTYKKRHHIIAVSKTVLRDFDHWVGIKGQSSVLYNVIEDVFFEAAPKQEFSSATIRLVAVGTLKKQKNYQYFIEAFKHMPANFSLDIYGSGPMEDELLKEIEKYGLQIALVGHKENMHRVLPEYDGYVMCSTHEGLSLALMEAMASGLPAFLSDIAVQRESAKDSAVYFDLNDPMDFIEKITSAFSDHTKLREMSRAGIARASEIARTEAYLRKLYALYASV